MALDLASASVKNPFLSFMEVHDKSDSLDWFGALRVLMAIYSVLVETRDEKGHKSCSGS